jgi:hypothetical protein
MIMVCLFINCAKKNILFKDRRKSKMYNKNERITTATHQRTHGASASSVTAEALRGRIREGYCGRRREAGTCHMLDDGRSLKRTGNPEWRERKSCHAAKVQP